MEKTEIIAKSRRFYEEYVKPLIKKNFAEYEDRIAVGIAGEGSDCFGYDDLISRDHDFGTGVCLWLTDEDFEKFGYLLSIQYNELVDSRERSYITDRIRERRGVMRIHDFYSNILCVDCDTQGCTMPDEKWLALDHTCLATAVNGTVFRDDLGQFSAFRKLLLNYYPDGVWRRRLAEELHRFSASLQVNYARCMTRGDIVASQICRNHGLLAAMELYFLLKRQYPPYYKWTYRALRDLDGDGKYAGLISALAKAAPDESAWRVNSYHPDRINTDDEIVNIAEQLACELVVMLNDAGLINESDPYLERYVNLML